MEHQEVATERRQQQVQSLDQFKENCVLMQNGLNTQGACARPRLAQ